MAAAALLAGLGAGLLSGCLMVVTVTSGPASTSFAGCLVSAATGLVSVATGFVSLVPATLVGGSVRCISIIRRYGLGSRNAEYSATSSTSSTTRAMLILY